MSLRSGRTTTLDSKLLSIDGARFALEEVQLFRLPIASALCIRKAYVGVLRGFRHITGQAQEDHFRLSWFLICSASAAA
jgi:hypothetical protein